MRITIRKRTEFAAAHFLPEIDSACQNVHGHNFVVEAFMSGYTDSGGMLKPFEDIKADLAQVVVGKYDHRLLNDVHPFSEIPPTTENIAETILRALLAIDNRYIRVRVWETGNNFAEAEV